MGKSFARRIFFLSPPTVRPAPATLAGIERALFEAQHGVPGGSQPVEARFRGLTLTADEQTRLLRDLRQLNTVPDGSRIRMDGTIDGRRFQTEVRNHGGALEVKLRGVQFVSRADAQAFVDSLRQAGAERVRVRGTINGLRFDARRR